MNRDTWQEILSTLGKNRVRTVLTALGVFWGILMLVFMLGMGTGLQQAFSKNMTGFAHNAVAVWPRRTSLPYDGLQPGRHVQFRTEDIRLIKATVPGIEHLAPRLRLGGWRGGDNASRGDKTGDFNVSGDYPAYQFIQSMEFTRGRFINALDMRDNRKVAVIGPRTYETLYARGEDPIGTHIKIRGVYFTVVGQFKPVGEGHRSERLAQTVFIPFTTFQYAFNQGDKVGWFNLTAAPGHSGTQLEADVRTALAKRHRVAPTDRIAFGSFNTEERLRRIRIVFVAIRVMVWFVGICTLLAGVLGVSNIMLIVIKERTKEFGIRKAVGATPWSIVSQVIQESTALTAIAGYLGLSAGVGALALADEIVGQQSDKILNPHVDLRVALIATAILIVSGVVAGIIPARNAVAINTVEALRAE